MLAEPAEVLACKPLGGCRSSASSSSFACPGTPGQGARLANCTPCASWHREACAREFDAPMRSSGHAIPGGFRHTCNFLQFRMPRHTRAGAPPAELQAAAPRRQGHAAECDHPLRSSARRSEPSRDDTIVQHFFGEHRGTPGDRGFLAIRSTSIFI
jgi:hypothetical protein